MSVSELSPTESTPVSESVIEAVADEKDVDPMELTTPLYSVIDPDALDRVVDSTPSQDPMDVHVTFTYSDCEVTVYGDGHVSVVEQAS